MKKGINFTNCISVIAIALGFASCSGSGSVEESIIDNSTPLTKSTFKLNLKVQSDGTDITTKGDVDNTTLFVFDQNNDYYTQITVDRTYPLQKKTIEINVPGSNKITVIAWSGIESDKMDMSVMTKANTVSDLQLTLKQENGEAKQLPSDIFYGKSEISSKETVQSLVLNRKVSSIALTTKAVLKVYDSKEGNYYYKVFKTKSGINQNGELSGNEISYIIPATMDNNGNLVANTSKILPNEDITVELYKDDVRILSSKNVKNATNLNADAGKQLNIVFDLSNLNSDVLVSSWASVVQYVTVG